MVQLQRYVAAGGSITGFNVVGTPEAFMAGGSSNSTAFVFGSPHERLPFPDRTFDNVVSMNILEHVQNMEVSSNVQIPGISCTCQMRRGFPRCGHIAGAYRACDFVSYACSCTWKRLCGCCVLVATSTSPGFPAGRAAADTTSTLTWSAYLAPFISLLAFPYSVKAAHVAITFSC